MWKRAWRASAGIAVVLATVLLGVAAPSAALESTTDPRLPGPVTDVRSEPRDGAISLLWDSPDHYPGQFGGYEVTVLPSGRTVHEYWPRATIDGLTNGESYTFEIRALNEVGASTPVVFGPAKVYTHPDPPVNVRVEAGHRTITVSWDPPADDGGDAISNYEVLVLPGYSRYDSGTATSIAIALDEAAEYTFTVRAFNRANESEESAPAGPIRPLYIAPEPTRIAGADRYATSAAVSRDAFEPGVPVAYLASGADYADALAGAAAAGKQGGPVLLTTRTTLPVAVAAELRRLEPQRIVVLGGPSVIGDSVIEQARRLTTGTVKRIYGADRYATSAAISAAAFSPGVRAVYIASGASFADALAAAPVAAAQGGPVLLASRTAIPSSVLAELKRLKPELIMLVGADAVLSDELWNVIDDLAPSVGKASGVDRFETAEMLMRGVWGWQPTAYVASGMDFPDALSAAAAAAAHGAPVLMTRPASLPAYAHAALKDLYPRRVVVVGGTSVVSPAVLNAVKPYMVD